MTILRQHRGTWERCSAVVVRKWFDTATTLAELDPIWETEGKAGVIRHDLIINEATGAAHIEWRLAPSGPRYWVTVTDDIAQHAAGVVLFLTKHRMPMHLLEVAPNIADKLGQDITILYHGEG